MGFYEELSRYYDEIFPVDNTEMRFFTELLAGKNTLLDIGCGTGNKTVHYAAPGRRITGIDLDGAMIAKAREEHGLAGMEYRVLDMQSLDSAFAPGSFDGALCLGNTLVHLCEHGELGRFLGSVRRLLTTDGRFLLQILNYDRILDKDIRSLPPLEGPNALFARRYRRDGPFLRFLTSLTLKASGETFDNDTLLYPLRREELAGLLKGVGFGTVTWYGSFDGAPLGPDSFILAALCGA